jgi:hypothetical protein
MELCHNLFLQGAIAKRCTAEEKWVELANECNAIFSVEYKLEDYIRVVNAHLSFLSLEIRKNVSETNFHTYLALVNLRGDALTKKASSYNSKELELFEIALQSIINSSTGSVSSIELLNKAASDKNWLKKEASKSLDKFVEDLWLEDFEGSFSIAPRTFMELQLYLQNSFHNLESCALCRDVCIKGNFCSSPSCKVKAHDFCIKKFQKFSKSVIVIVIIIKSFIITNLY